MKKIILTLITFFGFQLSSAHAQSLFYKDSQQADQKTSRMDLDFVLGEGSSIQFKDTKLFSRFTAPGAKILEEKILPRPVSEAEKVMQVGLWVLTGFAALATQDAYDLGGDLKLLSMRGVIFFIFPFESHYLYRQCGQEDLLVAVSNTPTAENLKRMKPLDEVHNLCDPKVHEEPNASHS